MQARECSECGSGAIPHRITYYSIVIDEFFRALLPSPRGSSTVARVIARIERATTPYFLEGLIRLGIARRVLEPDDNTQLLALMLWNEATERGIGMEEVRIFNLPRNIFLARLPTPEGSSARTAFISKRKLIAFEGIPLPPEEINRVHWMDDKAELKKRFRNLGLPVARGGDAITLGQARRITRALVPPLITKPFSGSGSRHTTLHLVSDADVVRGFRIAKTVAPRVVIEEELTGAVYRATVVDGVFAAALRRDQPYVIGDGKRTVIELVEEANKNPARSGPYFHPISLNEQARAELTWQSLSFDGVVENGIKALLNQKINWSVGGTTTDVTDTVHEDNIELFEEVARILKAPIVGLDFIILDISKSWKKQERCGILETNSMPFFDNHHLPFEGKPRNVASLIWDMNL